MNHYFNTNKELLERIAVIEQFTGIKIAGAGIENKEVFRELHLSQVNLKIRTMNSNIISVKLIKDFQFEWNQKWYKYDYLKPLEGVYQDPISKEKLSIIMDYPRLNVVNSNKGKYPLYPVIERRFIFKGQRYNFIKHDGRIIGIINNDKYYIKKASNIKP